MCLDLPNHTALQIMLMCRDSWGMLQALFKLLQAAAFGLFLNEEDAFFELPISLEFIFLF